MKFISLFLKLTFLVTAMVQFNLLSAQAEPEVDTAEAIPFVRFQYSYLFPSGDFESTFGSASTVGGAFGYKTANNWQFGVEGNFMFGADLKRKDLLGDLTNERGDITDSDGELIKLVYDVRGYNIFFTIGKLFPINTKNANSGVLTEVGAGFIQHKIFIDYRDGEVFQLNEEMLKGYDRLHNGFALKQFVGYEFFGKRNLANFYLGLEFQQGFTKNRREYNYDTRSFDKERKFDFLYGFRLGWAIPFKRREAEDFYYY